MAQYIEESNSEEKSGENIIYIMMGNKNHVVFFSKGTSYDLVKSLDRRMIFLLQQQREFAKEPVYKGMYSGVH